MHLSGRHVTGVKAMRNSAKGRRITWTWRLLGEYTICFTAFFAVVFSPFWFYGRCFLCGKDGLTQYLPELTYSRYWAHSVLSNLREGRFEIPLWSLWIGFGQSTLGNVISYRPLNFLFCLFPDNAIAEYALVRMIIGLYLSGLAFLAYGQTRTRNSLTLLFGCMIYLFSGFIPFYVSKHWLFMEMTFAFPMMLLGVDQIFDGKWSWPFVLTVFVIGMSYFYTLYMITVPAVIYAVFHFFELSREERLARGGFWRIFLRHVVQYATAVCLAMINLLPSFFLAQDSSRVSSQDGINLFFWRLRSYFSYIRSIVGSNTFAYGGYIGLPSIALIAIFYALYDRRKRDRAVSGQILLYNLMFLCPALTMLFSAFSGKTLRFCYVHTFWVAILTACVLPRLHSDDEKAFVFCVRAFCVYAVAYIGVSVWTGSQVNAGMVLAFVGLSVFYLACMTKWGRQRKRIRIAMLFLMLLVELTTKSYERFSPQYSDVISTFYDASNIVEAGNNNPVDALEMVEDDSVFRVDSALDMNLRRNLANYGMRNKVNGVSSYHNLNSERLVEWSLGVGNSHQGSNFEISDLAQRTVLNELAGVKYAVALENSKERVPYGYEEMGSREKVLANGKTTTEYLYKNPYALPLGYVYRHAISQETYASLTPNRKEQAMLQGVVLEEKTALKEAELEFDDKILLDKADIISIIEQTAETNEYLAFEDGVLKVKKDNFSLSIPVTSEEGEIYLQFIGLHYKAVNYEWEEVEKRLHDGSSRLQIVTAKRKARQWKSTDTAVVSASNGKLNDEVNLLESSDQYYFGKRNVLLNLGYGKIKKEIKIKFSLAGEYSFDDVALIHQPMESYANKVAPFMEDAALSTEIDGNHITLQFDLDQEALAYLPVLYTDGWSAKVDGKSADILPANVAFMGVMLPKGSHTLEFNYMPRGLRAGAIISLGTLAILVGVGIYNMLCRRKRG